jgi:hypothetical protein
VENKNASKIQVPEFKFLKNIKMWEKFGKPKSEDVKKT